MTDNPYDYKNRTGVRPVSWELFHGLCKGLAAAIAPYRPEILLPIGRAGYYPGTLLSHMLQVEIFPIRLSRRVNDVVVHRTPEWLLEPPASIRGCRVLVVDEISSTGETITLAVRKAQELGAEAVRSAVLYAHTRGVSVPDYIGLITDDLLLNPWDREIWTDGGFRFHPEYVEALQQQGLQAEASLLIDAPNIEIAKGGSG
jgi:hypoxanthine phosphoribosyltransferase